MNCNWCGNYVPNGKQYCGKCGNYIRGNNTNQTNNQYVNNRFNSNNKSNVGVWVISIVGIGFFFLIFIGVIFNSSTSKKYYYSGNSYTDHDYTWDEDYPDIDDDYEKKKTPVYKDPIRDSTIIVFNNHYSNANFQSENDIRNLIVQDSVSQKDNCPSEMRIIEDEFINEFGITAVNLCEMDLTFARGLKNVIRKMYNDYPEIKGYLTNLTLQKPSDNQKAWAWTYGVFDFADSNINNYKRWAQKTMITLEDRVYLHPEKYQTEVNNSSKSGFHAPNETIYSPLAHEMGHLISFIAYMKKYNVNSVLLYDPNSRYNEMINDYNEKRYTKEMLMEAYENNKRDGGTSLEFDSWRRTISEYAVSKDNEGNYQYDETIAEAFEDVYLNNYSAKSASRYIVNLVKSKLKG